MRGPKKSKHALGLFAAKSLGDIQDKKPDGFRRKEQCKGPHSFVDGHYGKVCARCGYFVPNKQGTKIGMLKPAANINALRDDGAPVKERKQASVKKAKASPALPELDPRSDENIVFSVLLPKNLVTKLMLYSRKMYPVGNRDPVQRMMHEIVKNWEDTYWPDSEKI